MRGRSGPYRATPPVVARRPLPRTATRPGFDRPAMRRAAALYLLSREAVARDVAFLLLPEPPDPSALRPSGAEDGRAGRNGRPVPAAAVRPGAADLMLWARGRVVLVGFAPSGGRPHPAQQRFAAALRGLGHDYRVLHAETPAHAVELVARLLDGREGR